MSKVSIIIPHKDDEYALKLSLPPLLDQCGDCEIIIIDNSRWTSLKIDDPRVRVLKNGRNNGVGMAFNWGVESARHENIVLMGCDVVVQPGFIHRVKDTLESHPNTIFNAVSSGFNDNVGPFKKEKRTKRNGAFIIYKLRKSHIPSNSPLQNDPKFSDILSGKWNYKHPEGDLPRIGCLMGACYWMRRGDFIKLRGWNGFEMWGGLEPWLSIKARAHGMEILLDKETETAHYFGRVITRPGKRDIYYYNKLFMAHTMFTPQLAGDLEWYLRYGDREEQIEKLTVNMARSMIKKRKGLVAAERDYNNRHFKGGLISSIETFERLYNYDES